MYHAENAQGQRIIDAINKIITRVAEEDVTLIEQTSNWMQYEENTDKQYKEYKVKLKREITSVMIQTKNEKECELILRDGQAISSLQNNDIFRVVVPKDVDQSFLLHIDYTIMQPVIYIGSSNTLQTQYIISRLYEKDKDYQLQIEKQNWVNVVIHNYEADSNIAIQGNSFKILDENKKEYSDLLFTNENGSIQIPLKKGKYYLKQISTTEGELQKELVPIQVTATEQVIHINIYNKELQQEETTTNEKEVNVTEENKQITQNHTKDIMNIHTTNLQTEIVNQTNQTNLDNVNHFVNTIYKTNTLNLTRHNYYNNEIRQTENIKDQELDGENLHFKKTKAEYNTYIDFIKVGTIDIPNLPIASNE